MVKRSMFWLLLPLVAHAAAACNPLTTNGCPAIPGLSTSSYSIDFTKEKSLPKDWILADASNVTFGTQGIQFNFNKRKDAPYIWTNFYVAYGRIDVEMKVASGTGVITSAVMFSDDADEIDWEFSGSNFGAGANTGKIQTNVFAKGITGNYDRGTLQPCSPPPQTSFHTYTLNWTPDRIDWILDGATKYSTTNNGQKTGNYQFPQTPSRLHIGIWDAGDPDTAAGTRNWAGGLTDYSKGPYIAYVKNVKITTLYPCKSWKYPDNFSGSWAGVKCTNETLPASAAASTTITSAKPKSTESTYTVVAGDNGYSIADKLGCTFDQLSAANKGINWDLLVAGQKLNNPNAAKPGTTTSSSGASSSTRQTQSSGQLNASSSSTSKGTSPGPSNTAGSSTAAQGATTSGAGAGSKTTTSSNTPSATGRRSCSADVCLNSMLVPQISPSALQFCANYTKTTTLAIPTYLSACNGNATRVMSACSCLYASGTTTQTGTGNTSRGIITSSKTASQVATGAKTTPVKPNWAASSKNGANGWSSNWYGGRWKRGEKSGQRKGRFGWGRIGDGRQHP